MGMERLMVPPAFKDNFTTNLMYESINDKYKVLLFIIKQNSHLSFFKEHYIYFAFLVLDVYA